MKYIIEIFLEYLLLVTIPIIVLIQGYLDNTNEFSVAFAIGWVFAICFLKLVFKKETKLRGDKNDDVLQSSAKEV